MNTQTNNTGTPQHLAVSATATETSTRLGLRARAAVMAGLLALSLSPAVALAEPAAAPDGQAQGGNPPAMEQPMSGAPQQGGAQEQASQPPAAPQQGGAQEQASQPPAAPQQQDGANSELLQQDANMPAAPQDQAGQQSAPAQDGTAPQGQPNQPKSDEIDDEVRSILSETYGIDTMLPAPSTDGTAPTEAPELPEGAVNIQQLIDSVRDAIRYTLDNKLDTLDLSDESVSSALAEQIQAADAQRKADMASGTKPSAQPSEAAPADVKDQTTDTHAAPAETPTESGVFASLKSDSGLLGNIVSFVSKLFGYNA